MNLDCEFYTRLFSELYSKFGISKDMVLKVLKPLYKVLKASNYWFKTYYLYYI